MARYASGGVIHFPEATAGHKWLGFANNEDVFMNPTKFWPERWITEDEAKLKPMNKLYMFPSLLFFLLNQF